MFRFNRLFFRARIISDLAGAWNSSIWLQKVDENLALIDNRIGKNNYGKFWSA
jgi:hypothetical protein